MKSSKISPIRIFDREHNGKAWVYSDQAEAELAFYAHPTFSVSSIDDFIEGRQGLVLPDEAIRNLLELRHEALQAYKRGDKREMMAHVRALSEACYKFGMVKAAELGAKFSTGRKPNTSGPIRKRIRSLLEKNHSLKNADLWDAIRQKEPRGWKFFDNTQGRYIEGPEVTDGMSYARFCNIASEERKTLKP